MVEPSHSTTTAAAAARFTLTHWSVVLRAGADHSRAATETLEELGRVQQVMNRLEGEYAASGRGRLFEHLEGCLVRDAAALPYAEIAARMDLSEAAVKMAMHRLRARYQAILREEIGKTVASPDEVEPELRDLFDAFRR